MPVSNSIDDRSGRLDETQANQIPKTNKKETTIERGNPCDSEIPEWLQEFREKLVDDEIPLQGGSHASSSKFVSKQSSSCSRGGGFCRSVDPDASMQNQNFQRNPEKFARVLGAREEAKSHLH